MKFCSNCGTELKQNADVCLNCGILVNDNNTLKSQSSDGLTLGIIGLCFSLIIPLVTWIVSGIGFSQSVISENKNGKIINLIALILSGVAALFYLLLSLGN